VRVVFHLPAEREVLDAALAGLVAINVVQLRRAGGGPDLYAAGVRYEREPRGVERWQSALDLLRTRRGDCEDLASYRAAWLRVNTGEAARAIAYRTGARKFHAVVARGDGTIEDPSRALGMGRRARKR
jgi:hypothetical protein